MSGISLKTKYAGAAFGAVLAATLVVIALLAWQHRLDVHRIGTLATESAREQVEIELQARAETVAARLADAAAPVLRSGNVATLERRMQSFQSDETLARITLRNADGATVYRWARDALPRSQARVRGTQPIRTLIENAPGIAVPRTIG